MSVVSARVVKRVTDDGRLRVPNEIPLGTVFTVDLAAEEVKAGHLMVPHSAPAHVAATGERTAWVEAWIAVELIEVEIIES